MNHLAHLALAGSDPAMLVGAMLGDHIKGRLKGELPTDVERGIRLHRAIDAYTDTHPQVKQSQRRFDPRFRRYSGIMLDVFFDYLLARSFIHYHEQELDTFSQSVLSTLVDHTDKMPERAALQVTRMQARNSLAAHGEDIYLENSYEFLATRLTRANPLNEAFDECKQHETDIALDFKNFYPQLVSYVADWKQHY